MFGIFMLAIFGSARAGCPVSGDELGQHVENASSAYLDWQFESFDEQVEQVRADLACLGEPISPERAAEVHELFAMVGGRAGDSAMTVAAFRGVLALNPHYTPGTDLAAKGSVLYKAYQQARGWSGGETRSLPHRGNTEWIVDGERRATELPADRAVVVQYVDKNSDYQSWYHLGGDLAESLEQALSPPSASPAVAESEPEPTVDTSSMKIWGIPDSAAVAESEPNPAGEQEIPSTSSYTTAVPGDVSAAESHPSRGLLVGGLMTTAVAVAGFALAEAFEADFSSSGSYSTYESKYNTAVGVTLASTAAGVAGGGLILGAVIKGEW